MRSKFLEPSADVSRDNNLYVVGDISKKCLDTTETNNYQVDLTISMSRIRDDVGHSELGG
jgi:uncharacterized protein YqiB (DUF1249 family)